MSHPAPPRRTGRRLGAALAVLALTAAACVDDEPAATPTPTPTTDLRSDDLVLTAALRTVDSCDALLAELKAEALERVGPYGLGEGWYGPAVARETLDEGGEAVAQDSEAAGAASDGAGGGDASYSSTNVQEAGIDEPDLVKTDGRRLVAVTGQSVRVVDLTAGAPTVTATIGLPEQFHGGELFLVGDRAVLLTRGWSEEPFASGDAEARMVPAGQSVSRLLEIDLAAARVVRSIETEGGYLSARDVAGTIRIVLSNAGPGLPFVLPSNPAAEAAAEAANRQVVQDSTIEQWLPAFRSLDDQGRTVGQGPLVPCERLHLPGQFAGFGTLSVLTLDPSSGLVLVDSVGVQTDGQMIYAAADRLVVATPQWIDPRLLEERDGTDIAPVEQDTTTALHTFDITDPTQARYVASGAVDGRLVNQFAMDVAGGLLRVATTEGEAWGPDAASESFVTVLREVGPALEVVGRVGGLGPGEQIQSVRFGDEVAYVVTFRQTDPFYVVDLTDPTAPRVAGELKIPGFSRYLHPLGGDHAELVIGVGQDATDEGRVTGAQLSLFDVSDPAAPRRVATLGLGQDSWTLASEDHRAFLWWEPLDLAVVPVSQFRWDEDADAPGEQFEGAVVVRLDALGQLVEVGRVEHPTVETCPEGPYPVDPAGTDAPAQEQAAAEEAVAADDAIVAEECWTWQPPIQRSVVVDDTLYTVSEAGVGANALADLAPVGFAPFDPA